MKDIIDEVSEDIDREKLSNLVKKYGKYCLSAALIVIVASAIYIYSNHKYIEKQENLSYKYYKLSEPSASLEEFNELIAIKGNIYAKLASFKYADRLLTEKKYDEAIKLLADVATDSKHEEIASLAKIRIVDVITKYKLYNARDKAIELLKKPMARNEALADIISLLLAQMLIESGKKDEGLVILHKLNDGADVSENIKFFANAILNSI